MRTTLTLDPDVEQLLRNEAHRRHMPFKQVVNDAIRRGLAPGGVQEQPAPYSVRPHRTELKSGIDAGGFNRLVEELEDEAIVAKMKTRPGTGGNLTTDVQIAAHAIEHGGEVFSNDSDFTRFEGLRCVNPLRG